MDALIRGDGALDPAAQRQVVAALVRAGVAVRRRRAELPGELTPREAEVLALIAEA